jgi:hypothetical protein
MHGMNIKLDLRGVFFFKKLNVNAKNQAQKTVTSSAEQVEIAMNV